MRIALFEPDIPQNTGNIFRLGACLGIPVDIIEPAGFILDNKKLKRASRHIVKQPRQMPGCLAIMMRMKRMI